MQQIIIKKSLLLEMARPKVERTIDPRIWAAMASLCSRTYKNDLGEFAKPIGTTKDVLLARYVSGLIILKQKCPDTPADIDKIKALKQYGHKLVDELNVPIEEIQDLYNENCGNLPKANKVSSTPKAGSKQPGGFFNADNIAKLQATKKPSVAKLAADELQKYITYTIIKQEQYEDGSLVSLLKGNNGHNYIAIVWCIFVLQSYKMYLYDIAVNTAMEVNSKKFPEMFKNVLDTLEKYNPHKVVNMEYCEDFVEYDQKPIKDLYKLLGSRFTEAANFITQYIDVDIQQDLNIKANSPIYVNIQKNEKGYRETIVCYTLTDITGKRYDESYSLKSIEIGKCINITGDYYKFLVNPSNTVSGWESSGSFSQPDYYYCRKQVSLAKPAKSRIIKYKPVCFPKAADAKKDDDGINNTIIFTANYEQSPYAYTNIHPMFKLDSYLKGNWDYQAKVTAVGFGGAAYIPSLAELIKAYKKYPEIAWKEGFIWSSTFADNSHLWAFDGHKVKALDVINDKAHVIYFLAFKKNNIAYSRKYDTVCLNPILIINGKPENFKKKPVLKITLNDIKKKYNNIQAIGQALKKYMKEHLTLDYKDNYTFKHSNMFDDKWNYTINGISLYKGDLMFNYWTGGDSTDEDGYITFNELPQHPNTSRKKYNNYAKTTCTFEYENMLETAQKFLFEMMKIYGE